MSEISWKEKAYIVVCDVAKKMQEFTPDDIWDAGLEVPSDGRALGAVMARANRDKVIENTWRTQPTRQSKSHNTPVRIWKSLIYVE